MPVCPRSNAASYWQPLPRAISLRGNWTILVAMQNIYVNQNPCFRAVGYSIMLCVLLALAEIKKRENPTPRPKPKSPNHPPRPLRGVSTSNNPMHQSADKQSAAAWQKSPNHPPRPLRGVSTSNNPLHQSADKRPAAARIKRRAALKLISVRPPSEISRQSRPKSSCSRGLRQSA